MLDSDENYDLPPEEDIDLEQFDTQLEEANRQETAAPKVSLSLKPMFQTLFEQSLTKDSSDATVLRSFAQHVVGPLSDHFGTVAAKGGAFFRQKQAEAEQQGKRGRDPEDYGRDQTMRAHLINGMLPALRIARLLKEWRSQTMRLWSEEAKYLFIAGFMLHDYTKIHAVQDTLEREGFKKWEPPSERQIPILERIFVEWCGNLGLDAFLQPIGGATEVVHDLIYIACNTQLRSGTFRIDALLPRMRFDGRTRLLVADVSRLADLIAYIAPTPRDLVADKTIHDLLMGLANEPNLPSRAVARLTYHHVAENRGLLLNFIHDAALDALTIKDQREPLLYAPSGVVYLERYDAEAHSWPTMPAPDELVRRIVGQIREKTGDKLVAKGKGAKRGNVGLQVDESYNDYFDLREFIGKSVRLTEKFIRNNKSRDRLTPIQENGWASSIPPILSDPKDVRLDQLAEWAGLMEVQLRERFGDIDLAEWLLPQLGIEDMAAEFNQLRDHPQAKKGGIKYWWFWAAGNALARKPGMTPEQVVLWIEQLAHDLAAALPEELPESAKVNEATWLDLTDYIAQVLTLGNAKSMQAGRSQELEHYVRAKGGRGGAVCALCGQAYVTRKQAETAVAFQPGVYTARVRIGAADNKRSMCSVCALEQLLRQLFMDNLDSGSSAEGQRVRYLSFYPSYFFTPETLQVMKRVYRQLTGMRLSNTDMRKALQAATLYTPSDWQRLDTFMLRAETEEPSRRVLRYSADVQSTFLMVGFRNFNDPTDAESWILPAFLSLVLPVCLDVKVVASESGVPLLLEADELPETVWFDGAHAAIQALTRAGRLNVDEVLPTLTRLAAAYLIHLDTEYEPPKENWHRFPPIAHTLMESPLYVFHYLKKQERDGQPVSADQVRRYVAYAESIFAVQGDMLMSHAKELVTLYRRFYRAKNIGNANSILRPLSVVSDALLVADPRLFGDPESLVEVAYGELYRFMDRVSKGLADGRFPKGISVQEREQAMRQFCEKFVNDVFVGTFNKDVAALRGKQLNLLKSACEVLYRNAQQQEWAERGQAADDEADEDTEPNESNV